MKNKKPDKGMNKKVLKGLTESAPVMQEMKPTMHLHGKDAQAMHGMKPGSNVKMMVHGKVMTVGIERYGEKGPMAEVEIHKVQMHKGKKGMDGMGKEKESEEAEE